MKYVAIQATNLCDQLPDELTSETVMQAKKKHCMQAVFVSKTHHSQKRDISPSLWDILQTFNVHKTYVGRS